MAVAPSDPASSWDLERSAGSLRPRLDLDRVLAIWSRRKWVALVAVAVPLTIATSVILFMPQIYQAKVTVLVDRQQVPETFVQPTVTSALETRLQTISREILSRSRLETLIERFGLYQDLKSWIPPEDVAERMRAAIDLQMQAVHIKGGQATVAFTLSYRGTDPEIVAVVAKLQSSNANVAEAQAHPESREPAGGAR